MVGIGYIEMMDPMTHYNGHLIALVESWDASTNTFILPTSKCMITLEDVYRNFLDFHRGGVGHQTRSKHQIIGDYNNTNQG